MSFTNNYNGSRFTPVVVLIILTYSASLLLPMVHSANILFYSNVASYSHRVTLYPLADALSKRGHQVTFLNAFRHRGPYINPNITDIVPKSVEKYMHDWLAADFDINHRVTKTFQRIVYALYPAGAVACQKLFESPELSKFYEDTPTLDLVVIDNCMADCGAAIAYRYGAKHIIFNTVTHFGNEFDLFGFLPESSAIPEYEINPPVPPMTFLERVVNSLISIHFRWEHYKYIKELDTMARKHLNDPSMPFLDDLIRNTSLVLYTGDVVTDHPRSHAPLFVDIGGVYCQNSTDEFPLELKSFLEEGLEPEGIVYISLGSLAISSNLPERVKQVFMDTIRLFPHLKFIWKWDSPIPPNKPENLYLAKWLPQTKILGHPKTKAFVTQCGRPSTLEAICNAVPMVAFPVLGDQDNNANRMNRMGGNVKMELATVTKEEFSEALTKVVNNERMKERMHELRKILLDRPMSGLDTAVWWTEYVLRHKDTSHLRPAGFDQWWFQRRLLDVWAFLFTIILAGILSFTFVCMLLTKNILRSLRQQGKPTRKIKKS